MSGQSEQADAVQRILEDRARLVARAPVPESTEEMIDVVVVALGSERYGLETIHVSEVQHLGAVAPVPGLPPVWVGLVNLRSQLVPLLDLRACLDLSREKETRAGQIVLVEAGGVRAGLLVDEVLEVQRLPRTAVGPPLSRGPAANRKSAQGLTAGLLTVLDLEALLTDPRLVVDDHVR